MIYIIFSNTKIFKVSVKDSVRVSAVLIFSDLSRSNSTCFTYLYVRRSSSESNVILISLLLCAALSVGEDPRGSPSSSTFVGSKKSKRAAVSHLLGKGDFVQFGASLRIMYTAVANLTTPGDRGDTTISNRVLPLSFVFFLSSFFYSCCSYHSVSKIRWMPATNRLKTIDKPLLIAYMHLWIFRHSRTYEVLMAINLLIEKNLRLPALSLI